MARHAGKLVATMLVGTYWAIYVLHAPQRAVEFLPSAAHQFLASDVSVAIGLEASLALGIYVGRWWAVGAAGIPLIALAAIQAQGHVSPFDGSRPLADWKPLLAFLAVPIVAGILLRLVYDRVVARASSNRVGASS